MSTEPENDPHGADPSQTPDHDFSPYERQAVLAEAFTLHLTGAEWEEVANKLADRFKGMKRMKSNTLSACWSRARKAKKVQIRYVHDPYVGWVRGLESDLTERQICDFVNVVPSSFPAAIARAGADRLCELMRKRNLQEEFHIGFAGGRTPGLMAKALADTFSRTDPADWGRAGSKTGFPNKVYFYSLVGTPYDADPGVDPNSYSLHFAECPPEVTDRVHFRSCPAPNVYLAGQRAEIRDLPIVQAAREQALANMDVIVTSCGHAKPKCKSFWDHIEEDSKAFPQVKGQGADFAAAWKETTALLERHEVLGDMAWFPVTPAGLRDVDNFSHNGTEKVLPVWASTLLTYQDLVDFASRPRATGGNGRVLLLVGPCSGDACNESKGRLLKGILASPQRFVTDLIVDSRSANEYLRPVPPPPK